MGIDSVLRLFNLGMDVTNSALFVSAGFQIERRQIFL